MRSRTPFLDPFLAPALLAAALGCGQDAQSPTAPEPARALDIAPARALAFRQVGAGFSHTCGVTQDDRAYCWGTGPLGGIQGPSLTPVAVLGGLRFLQVSSGTDYSCGVNPFNRAYCWGTNTTGQLGDGTTADFRPTPVRVVGRLRFRQVAAANGHTCGVTTDDQAYCWGNNSFGQIGDGTRGIDRRTPVPVSGGLRFRQVSAGLLHTCGVTLDDTAWCWGLNSQGQLGGGPPGDLSLTPVRVEGGLRFRRVIAGWSHSCAVTPDDRAYCWGENIFAQLGDGTTTTRQMPLPVAGELRFRQVSAAGRQHTCGVTVDDLAYCWGSNRDGQLGDGTVLRHRRPFAVAGGLRFRQVSARFDHTCGVTLGNVAYCWGLNSDGQLGNGTTTTSLVPVAVAAPVP